MPNCITHFLQAKAVLSALPENIKISLNRNAYFWAAQGSDFLFCHRFLPWMHGDSIKEYEDKIHRVNPSSLFTAFKSYLDINPDNEIAHSYVLGFINHYTLDSIAHPYVISLALELLKDNPAQNEDTLHVYIESSIDTIMLRKETGKLPSQVNLKAFLPKDTEVQHEIAKLYVYIIFELFHVKIDDSKVYQATADARKVFALLNDPTTLKKKIFTFTEKGKPQNIGSHILPLIEDSSVDFVNASEAQWTNESGETSSKTFFELFDDANDLSVKLIEDFDKGSMQTDLLPAMQV